MIADSIQTHDGLRLNTNYWTVPNAKADIVFIHGFFEHSGRYKGEASFFGKDRYNFYAYDQRAHGLSEGKYRSYIKSFDNYLQDFKSFLASLNIGKDRPYFLFSHSMGGLVLCSYLVDDEASNLGDNFKGVILSAPLLMPDKNTAPLMQKLSGIIGRLFPKMKTVGIDHNEVSRDPEQIDLYINDPLNYTDKIYASSGYQLLKQMKTIKSKLSKISQPFFLLHGTDDRLVNIDGSRMLFNKATTVDKEYVELENFKHEITKDIGKEDVLHQILAWMNKRL